MFGVQLSRSLACTRCSTAIFLCNMSYGHLIILKYLARSTEVFLELDTFVTFTHGKESNVSAIVSKLRINERL